MLPSKKTAAATPTHANHGMTQIYQWVASPWVIIIVELKPVSGHHYSGEIVWVQPDGYMCKLTAQLFSQEAQQGPFFVCVAVQKCMIAHVSCI